jgi:hypothetical protein
LEDQLLALGHLLDRVASGGLAGLGGQLCEPIDENLLLVRDRRSPWPARLFLLLADLRSGVA